MEKNFTKVHSTKDIVITSVLIIAGTIMVALPTSTPVNILGFFMIFAGIILALALRTGYKDVDTGIKYCKTERFFAQSMREEINRALAGKPDSINLSEEDKGNGIRLDIYHSKSTGKAFIQLFEYVPYKYEPCSKLYEYDLAHVSHLIDK